MVCTIRDEVRGFALFRHFGFPDLRLLIREFQNPHAHLRQIDKSQATEFERGANEAGTLRGAGLCFYSAALTCMLYDEDACLVEEPHGEGDEGEGEDVGGGGDDGGYDEQGYDDVAAVAAHQRSVDDVHAPQYPADGGDLEEDAHGEGDAHEAAHVGLDGDGVGHGSAHLVAAEEAEHEGEDEVVADEYAQEEEEVAAADEADGMATLVLVEGGRHEVEELVDEVGGGEEYAGIERGSDVEEELVGEAGVDELHVEPVKGALRGEDMARLSQQTVGDEALVLWGEDDVKQLLLEEEGGDGTHHHGDGHAYEAVAQLVEVFPEGHTGIIPLSSRPGRCRSCRL